MRSRKTVGRHGQINLNDCKDRKMESALGDEVEGTGSKVHGDEGDFVDEDEVLVTIKS